MNKQEIERAIAWNEDMLAYAKDSRVTYEDVCGTGDMTEEDREQLYNSMDSDIKMFETVISALTQQLNNGWIPVSDGDYKITVKGGEVIECQSLKI